VAESIVTLRVEARNAISSLNKTSAATKTLSNSAKGATASLTTASTAAKGLGASLAASLGPLLTVGAAVATVSNAIRTFSDRERDVTILRQGLENLGAGTLALNELQEAADRLGNTTLFNQEEFTRGFNLLTSFRNIGVDAYERVAQAAADIAQVNQVDVNTSFMQLAKALQDPERNLANLNRSGIAFTKTQTEVIKELMKTNKTAEAHAMILGIVEESYNGLAQAASEGFAGNVDTLGEAFRDFSETLGKALEPALIAVTKGLTALIKAADDLFKSPLGKTAGLFSAIALAAKGVMIALPIISAGLLKVAAAGGVATIALNAIPFVAIAGAVGLLTTAFFKLNGAKKEFNNLLNEGKEDEVTQALRDQAKVVGELNRQHNAAKGRDKKALARKLKEAELELKMLEGRLQTLHSDKKIEEAANNIVKLKTDQNVQNGEAIRLTDIQKKHHQNIVAEAKKEMDLVNEKKNKFNEFLKKQERSKQLLEATINGNREEVELQHAINDAVAIHGEQNRQKITDILTANKGLEDQANKTKEVTTAAESLKEKFKQIGETVRTDLVNNLTDAIMGAKSFGDAMRGVLDNLKRQLIQLALNKAIGAIGNALSGGKGFGGGFLSGLFGKRARGGPVSAGGAFVVGEKGPEILQMGSKGGNIIPNNAIGGGDSVVNNISVNVDASGSAVSGSSPSGNELGQQIAVAIQAELIKQKRAGGLLA
jgi:hypothetical protein